MTRPLKTLTVAQLTAQLQALPPEAEVRVWLPGSTIALACAFAYRDAVRIEGNVDPGSAIDAELSHPALTLDTSEWRQIIEALRSSKGDSPASPEDRALADKLMVRP